MNVYLTDSLARDHAETMMATAAASHRAKLARQSRRRVESSRATAGLAQHRSPRGGAALVGHFARRPITAVHSWFAAGQL